MGKKALSLALALVMALSLLPTTAIAAEPYLYDIKLVVPDGGVPPTQVTGTYQLRNIQDRGDGTSAYGAVSEVADAPCVLPLNFGITIEKLRRGSGTLPTDIVMFYAWSDPDNDGVYEQRVFRTRSAESEYTVVPLTEKGPFVPTEDVTYTNFQAALLLGFKTQFASPTYSMTLDTNQLSDIFGPNTLLLVSVVETTNYTPRMDYLVLLTGKAATPAFTDVPAGEWYADPVAWAVDKGITNGTSSTKFSPTQDCTQAQILTFLYRAERGEGEPTAADMDKAISWAREKGMIDNSFDGNKPCTRSTAVSYIWQAFNKPTAKASSFTDVLANAAYATAVDWAVEKGVTKGDGSEDTFAPDKVCTRGHIVTFLYRAYSN